MSLTSINHRRRVADAACIIRFQSGAPWVGLQKSSPPAVGEYHEAQILLSIPNTLTIRTPPVSGKLKPTTNRMSTASASYDPAVKGKRREKDLAAISVSS
jgi:hypothetical protein